MTNSELEDLARKQGFVRLCVQYSKASEMYREVYDILTAEGVTDDKARAVAAKIADKVLGE